MRIARVQTGEGAVPVMWQDGLWAVIDDPFAVEPTPTGQTIDADTARLLAPSVPTVILGMAHNGSRADRALPPQAFHKSARTLAGPGDVVPIDESLGRVVVEGELGVVIRRRARRLQERDALDAVLGYTVVNDVSAADQSPLDSFWTQTKNGENYSPVGPWIETDLDPSALSIRLRVAGAEVATGSTADLARSVPELLTYVTRYMELGPGDVIMTGCPGTMHAVHAGEEVAIEIEGIGTLANLAG
ncbi:fumarylacetoacetate hydrolase family protein [Pseudolysinimonas kribbensis]|uniref:2-hydroxyhepta-2,4-diene-1,7-dioate isomerase n=1 Tax=Pseudolysinimonas kribbensis TaxID=433641 RepID=A0ABQ6K7J5_9MICO|nr:fumarylacetoacetate hydrolase family protein [Pseudolysinimonas kribbensis]GMA94716.1 2-hydroxyhepta-2,4-diene-1,7-dioate isomerase [Pseudolysinimonas kribbensis]